VVGWIDGEVRKSLARFLRLREVDCNILDGFDGSIEAEFLEIFFGPPAWMTIMLCLFLLCFGCS
jgi:hypothetical protein